MKIKSIVIFIKCEKIAKCYKLVWLSTELMLLLQTEYKIQ